MVWGGLSSWSGLSVFLFLRRCGFSAKATVVLTLALAVAMFRGALADFMFAQAVETQVILFDYL